MEYASLSDSHKNKFQERRDLFLQNQSHPLLHNHKLHGKYNKYRSINITGDLRVIYEPVTKDSVLFIYIGTHSNLYK